METLTRVEIMPDRQSTDYKWDKLREWGKVLDIEPNVDITPVIALLTCVVCLCWYYSP